MSEPLTLTLAAVLVDANPFAELLAVMSPVETIVPVLTLLRPIAVVPIPPVSVVEVAVTVPVPAFLMPFALEALPPVTELEVIIIVPELEFKIPGLLEPLTVQPVSVIVPTDALRIALLVEDTPLPPTSADELTDIDPVEEFKTALALFDEPAAREEDAIVIEPLLLLLRP
jgi:hypothetical protein